MRGVCSSATASKCVFCQHKPRTIYNLPQFDLCLSIPRSLSTTHTPETDAQCKELWQRSILAVFSVELTDTLTWPGTQMKAVNKSVILQDDRVVSYVFCTQDTDSERNTRLPLMGMTDAFSQLDGKLLVMQVILHIPSTPSTTSRRCFKILWYIIL